MPRVSVSHVLNGMVCDNEGRLRHCFGIARWEEANKGVVMVGWWAWERRRISTQPVEHLALRKRYVPVSIRGQVSGKKDTGLLFNSRCGVLIGPGSELGRGTS